MSPTDQPSERPILQCLVTRQETDVRRFIVVNLGRDGDRKRAGRLPCRDTGALLSDHQFTQVGDFTA